MTTKPKRKLIDVDLLRTRVNTMLATPDTSLHKIDDPVAFRMGVCSVLEHILFTVNGYSGFTYQASEWDADKHGLRDNYDDSRRRYL